MSNPIPDSASAVAAAKLFFHLQDDSTYCGAAVAQMVLRSITGTLYDQDELALENSGHDQGTVNGASVDALATTLNAQASAHFMSIETNGSLDTTFAVLDANPNGVAALVQNGEHWVFLNEVHFDESSPPAPIGIFTSDPHGQSYPHCHADGDDCGRGDGSGNVNVLWTTAMLENPDNTPLALVYRATASANGVTDSSTGSQFEANSKRLDLKLSGGSGLIAARSAARPAITPKAREWMPAEPCLTVTNAIRAIGIERRGPLERFLSGFRATSSTAVGNFFQVTLETYAGVVGYALLDRSGELLVVVASEHERPLLDPSHDVVLRELRRNAERIAKVDPYFMCLLKQRHADVKAAYFWRRCREAPLPTQPLMRISIGTHVLYRSHFGRYYTKLTLLDR